MKKFLFISFFLLFFSTVWAAGDGNLNQGMVNPGFYEKPEWFKDSFLELPDELDDANASDRQVILYFHQDGCPYCKKLLDDNFSRPDIVEKMQQHFNLLEINMWGDKTVTLLSGDELSEKDYARKMKVMFTPTLVIMDSKGQSQYRMNGYYGPEKFLAALNSVLSSSVSKGVDEKQSNNQLLSKKKTERFIYKGNNLARFIQDSQKPVMILFEQGNCSECDELHGDIFRRLPVYKQLKKFSIAQVDINSDEQIVSPDGKLMTQKELAKQFKIQYTPTMIFYESGKNTHSTSNQIPIFRAEAYLKYFHVQALYDYILSKAYLSEPEFQRYVQSRAEKMRVEGVEVELWD